MDTSPTMDTTMALLCDAQLLRYIASFQRGVPHDVALFVNQAGDVNVVEFAIRRGDLRMLQRLYRYHLEQPVLVGGEARTSFQGAVHDAIAYGSVPILEWLASAMPERFRIDDGFPILVINRDSFATFQWLLTEMPAYKRHVNERILECVARLGHLQMFQWLEQHVVPFPYSVHVMNEAAEFGHLEMVKYLHARWPDVNNMQQAMDAAGNLEILQYLYDNSTTGFSSAAMQNAAHRGRLDMVQYLHDRWPDDSSSDAMEEAITSGSVDVVEFLHLQRHEAIDESMLTSASTVEMVQFFHRHGPDEWPPYVMTSAASRGHLAIVQFLCEHRMDEGFCDEAIASAVVGGHLAVVRYLHERIGCTHHHHRQYQAQDVDGGQLELVQYLHDHDIEADMRWQLQKASCDGATSVVQFLNEQYPQGGDYTVAAREAASLGHLQLLQYLLHALPRLRSDKHLMTLAAGHGRLPVVRYLHENYHASVCSPVAMGEAAAEKGCFRVVQYLHQHCAGSDGEYALTKATTTQPVMSRGGQLNPMASGDLRTVALLVERRSRECLEEALARVATIPAMAALLTAALSVAAPRHHVVQVRRRQR